MPATKELPSLEALKERFNYNPETGELTYKKQICSRTRTGQIAGYLTDRGWLRVKIGGSHFRVARVVWKIYYGEDPPPGMVIDHINRIRTDNRITNLRLASYKENTLNSSRVLFKKETPPKPKKTKEELREIHKKAARKTPLMLITPKGKELFYDSITEAATKNGLNRGSLLKVLRGTITNHKNYTARYANKEQ